MPSDNEAEKLMKVVLKYTMAEIAANLKTIRDKISHAAAKRAPVLFFFSFISLHINVYIK